MMNKTTCVIVVLLINFFACKPELSRKEFGEYISDPENGLKREKELAGLKFQLSYFPLQVLASSQEEVKRKMESDYGYFILKVRSETTNRSPLKSRSKTEKEYLNRLYYVQTSLKKDFSLLVDGKEYPCVLLEYEDDHNILNEMKIVIAFKKPASPKDLVVRYEDNLFGQGLINFKFDPEKIESIPALKI